jgi:hypothetical protein
MTSWGVRITDEREVSYNKGSSNYPAVDWSRTGRGSVKRRRRECILHTNCF